MLRHRFAVAVVIATAALSATSSAQAADHCVGAGGCFPTIQAAINSPGTTDGDRIFIEAGTYNVTQVIVNKGVELIGAGQNSTIVDGSNATGMPSAGTLRLDALGDDIAVSALTIRNAGTTGGTPGSGQPTAVAVKGVGALGRTYSLRNVRIEGRGTGADQALWADNSDVDLEVEDSTIVDNGGNAVLLDKHRGATRFAGNTVDPAGTFTAIFVMSSTGDRVSAPQRFTNNLIIGTGGSGISINGAFGGGEGGFRDVAILDNTITGTTTGVHLSNQSTQPSGAEGLIYEPVVVGNRLTGSGAAGGRGVNVAGAVLRAAISDNSISGYPAGVRFANHVSQPHGPSQASVRANRIVGNAVGLENSSASPVDAEENWWGCNEGPGAPGCDTVGGAGAAAVDRTPWLVLSASASPASIQTGGGESLIGADLLTTSDGAPAGSGPGSFPAAFSTTLGSISSPAQMMGGRAFSTLTSGSTAGTATVSATADNETATTTVTFTAPPAGPSTTSTAPAPVVVNAPSATSPPGLRLIQPDLTGVYPSGRFFVHAVVQGPGVLLARGTVTGGRLAGRRYSVPATDVVRLRMRVPRAVRRALNRGRRVTSRVTVSFTPRGATAPITRSVTLRMGVRKG